MAHARAPVRIALFVASFATLGAGDEMQLKRFAFLPALRPIGFTRGRLPCITRQPIQFQYQRPLCRAARPPIGCADSSLHLPVEFPKGLSREHGEAETQIFLDQDNVHVWMVEEQATEKSDEEFVRSMCALLSPQELARYQRNMANAGAQDQAYSFLVARALLRTTLSRYCPSVAPNEWIFVTNKYGRPCVDWDLSLGFKPFPEELRALRFNLSHCSGLIVCAFALGREVGIDSESTGRRGRTLSVAKRFFTSEEYEALQTVPEHAQPLTFFRLWTLKEAYVKARGLGIAAIGLDNFAFSGIDILQHEWPEGQVRADLSGAGDRAAEWQFVVLNLGQSHAAAVAVSCPEELEPAALTYLRTVPLRGPDSVVDSAEIQAVLCLDSECAVLDS